MPATADARPRGDDGIPLTWEPGDVILDLYEVRPLREGLPVAEGGMGRVNRVWHRQWQTHLAVKSVHPGRLKSTQAVDDFKREAEEWVNRIGLHPHVVSCFYVRILGGLPRVFVEFVEGGSLGDWIRTGQLYEGGPKQALRRMLDVAIQFAWGLDYVHELGLIHQDVKPLNVMMTADGAAKVTDFGLANARAKAFGEDQEPPEGHTLLATYGGMTQAYCSPEQAAIAAQRKAGAPLEGLPKLTRRTDVWSWAVSVLEMFLGRIAWPSGSVAHIGLKREAEDPRIPKMPDTVRELLQRCLQQRPDDRPHDLKEVGDVLQGIYQEVTDERCPREMPRAAEAVADTLNNRAVSLWDLDRKHEAERRWQDALKVDPNHPEASYNWGLIQWRSARQTDEQLLAKLRNVSTSWASRAKLDYLLGLVHGERGDAEAAVPLIKGGNDAAAEDGAARSILKQICSDRVSTARALKGHTGWVFAVALSPDDRLALSGSADFQLRLWDIAAGRCVQRFEGHDNSVTAVAAVWDRGVLLSGGLDETIRVWEVSTGRCQRILPGHVGGVSSLSPGGSGRLVLSAGKDGLLKLWEVGTGRCAATFQGHVRRAVACLSGDGRLALSGGFDGLVRLWDVSTRRCIGVLEGHSDGVFSVCLSADARQALSASRDATLRWWDVGTGQCLRTLRGHTRWVHVISLTADGRYALSGSWDETIRLWELATGRCLRTRHLHTRAVGAVGLSRAGETAVLGGHDGVLELWTTGLKPVPFVAPAVLARVSGSEAIAGAEREYKRSLQQGLASLAQGNARETAGHLRRARSQPGCWRRPEVVRAWVGLYTRLGRKTLQGGWEEATLTGHGDLVTAVAFGGDGRLFVSSSDDGSVLVWDLAARRCLLTLLGHEDHVRAVCLSQDGELVLSGGFDRTLKLWETQTGRCLRTFGGHADGIHGVWLASGGREALSASGDRTLKLWNVTTGRCLRTFSGHAEKVLSVHGGGDGRWAVSASRDRTLKVWDVATGRCQRTLSGHTEEVWAAYCSRDGIHAVSASADGTARLWELASGRCLQTFRGHTKGVSAACLTEDSRFVVTGGMDGTVKVWDATTGLSLRTFEGHMNWVLAVGLSPDGQYVLSGSADRSLKLWTLDWELEEGRRSEQYGCPLQAAPKSNEVLP
jgi:WD40 repeat protein